MMMFLRQAAAGLRMLLVLTVLTGILYPAVVLAVGRLMPDRADGSMIEAGGRVVGSRLIGQTFEGDEWFQSRPSVAGDGYDPLSTGASNLGPESGELVATVQRRRVEVAEREGVAPAQVPADAVTASGSGLDPHISPEYAALQVARVARVNDLDPEVVDRLVAESTTPRQLGFLGAPAVNVLEVNVAVLESTG